MELGFRNVYSIDLSTQGVRKLKDYCPRANVATADAVHLPFKDNTMDTVLMVGIVYEIPQMGLHTALFKEVHRVLREGGQLLFINNAHYNFGERVYDLTQRVEMLKHGKENYQFYIWRYSREDVYRYLNKSVFWLVSEYPCNQHRGVFKFLYGLFVPNTVKEARRKKLEETNYAAYTLNEQYLVSKDPSLLTPAGRLLVEYTKKHLPYMFAATVCYRGLKR